MDTLNTLKHVTLDLDEDERVNFIEGRQSKEMVTYVMFATNHGKYIEWGAPKKKDKSFYWKVPLIFQTADQENLRVSHSDFSRTSELQFSGLEKLPRASSEIGSEVMDEVNEELQPRKAEENHDRNLKYKSISKLSSNMQSEGMQEEFYSLPNCTENVLMGTQIHEEEMEESRSFADDGMSLILRFL